MNSLPGYGDEETWPPYDGHVNDPRRPLDEEDEEALKDLLKDIYETVSRSY